MRNKRIIIFCIILSMNALLFGNSREKKIEELKAGTLCSEVIDEIGTPDGVANSTNLPVLIYKISDTEFYRLEFRHNGKLWKLSKVVNGKEHIIFMDIRVK